MRSARGVARLLAGLTLVASLWLPACEEDSAVFGPLDDQAPPVVSITGASQSGDTLVTTVKAEDFIHVAFVVTELRSTSQFTTIITAAGDTLTLGRLLAVDTSRFIGRVQTATVNTTFFTGFTQATPVDIRAVAQDAQGNEAVDVARILVGGGPGGGLGGPQVVITSPLANQTVRDNTLIRVGVQASDPTGLAQLNVVLTGLTPPTIPAADTTRFTQFRTSVDTLLDFFIPQGSLGQLTITAEAINLNTISGFAQITVNVAQVVSGDTIPPIVSMLVTGGVQRRQDEPPRMESDDSLVMNLVAQDQETAITRMGVTLVVTNQRAGGAATATVTQEQTFSPAISGTVPFRFTLTPNSLPAAVFTDDDIPDTLFFEITGWAFDAASPSPNCGATVDPEGSANIKFEVQH